MNVAIGQMDTTTQQNSALVEQMAAAAESLEEQSELLKQATGRFQVGEARPSAASAYPRAA